MNRELEEQANSLIELVKGGVDWYEMVAQILINDKDLCKHVHHKSKSLYKIYDTEYKLIIKEIRENWRGVRNWDRKEEHRKTRIMSDYHELSSMYYLCFQFADKSLKIN